MRARKHILLWCRTAQQLSEWRLVLETRLHVRVLPAGTLLEASRLLVAFPDVALVMTQEPGNMSIDVLRAHHDVPVLLFGIRPEIVAAPGSTSVEAIREQSQLIVANSKASHALCGTESTEAVLEWAKRLMARKRGPKPVYAEKIGEIVRLRMSAKQAREAKLAAKGEAVGEVA